MFKRILLPLDLTDKHHEAIDRAVDLALVSAGEVVLLHVIETIPALGPDEEKTFYDRLERVARKHLDQQGAKLAARKVAWRSEIRFGNRTRETVRYAVEAKTDLIVLTAPRFDPNNPASGWGSMSWRISLLAGCPILLARA